MKVISGLSGTPYAIMSSFFDEIHIHIHMLFSAFLKVWHDKQIMSSYLELQICRDF